MVARLPRQCEVAERPPNLVDQAPVGRIVGDLPLALPKFDGAISRQLPCAFSCSLVIWRDELDLPHEPTLQRPAQVDAILVVRKLVPVTQLTPTLQPDFERPCKA